MKLSKKINEFIHNIWGLEYEMEKAYNNKYYRGNLSGEKWLSIPRGVYNNAFDKTFKNLDLDDDCITQFYLSTLVKAKYFTDDEQLAYLTKLTSIIRAEIEEETKEAK